ncbi:hypothetical protein AtNW77_Chr4g0279501 [Arabidopsis thaliana]
MPAGILRKIVSHVAEGGIGELRNWIISGREGMVAVFSLDSLKLIRLVSVFLFLDIEEAIMVVTNVKEV